LAARLVPRDAALPCSRHRLFLRRSCDCKNARFAGDKTLFGSTAPHSAQTKTLGAAVYHNPKQDALGLN